MRGSKEGGDRVFSVLSSGWERSKCAQFVLQKVPFKHKGKNVLCDLSGTGTCGSQRL